jgi:alcohol dehydrogenase class IV
MAMRVLPGSFAGEKDVRLEMHKAAAMAGMAFSQAGLGLCHAMAHSLGGLFHVPHGRLNAILLPAVVDVNAQGSLHKYAQLARESGFTGAGDTMAVRNLRNGLVRLRRELQLPDTLAQAGVDVKALRSQEQKIVETVLLDPCCDTNPVKVEPHLVRQVLSEVVGRG